MKIELQAALFQDYPRFFRRRKSRDSVTRPIDAYGIETGDGWHVLIGDLARQYEEHINQLVAEGVAKRRWPRSSQIKEKFGTLRFYVENSKYLPKHLIDATERAESESASTCENCGEPGTLRRSSYWCVMCDRCQENLEQEGEFDVAGYLNQLRDLLKARSL